MTATRLADELTKIGLRYSRAQVTNLEAGVRRETVTVGEILAFAKVLNVPPLLLILPLDSPDRMEVLPGVVDDPWTAWRWFTGEFPTEMLGMDRDPADQFARSDKAAQLVHTFREHQNALRAFLLTRGGLDEEERRELPALDTVVGTRVKMHREGWPMPPLPDDVRPDLDARLRRWGFRVDGDGIAELGPDERMVDITGGTS